MSGIEQVEAASWEGWIESTGGSLLDIREPFEWEQGVLPGAVKISMSELVARIAELDKATPFLVVCRSGARSQQVALYLTAQGYEAANMAGGMKALGLQD